MTFDQDFEQKVFEIANEIFPEDPPFSISYIIEFAKRFYDMDKEG